MRYLVLSDIHANIDALDAVLADAAERVFDRVLVLGDLVGYGAAPGEVIARVRSLDVALAVRGNHDKVVAGLADGVDFNPIARESAAWTARELNDDERGYLRSLSQGSLFLDGEIQICHGSPDDEDRYVFDSLDAIASLQASLRPLCLFGHTHAPLATALLGGELVYFPTEPDAGVEWTPEGGRYLVNVGSVGQPRDADPRAAYGIVDAASRRVTFARVGYPLDRAQARIREAGLPEPLAARLRAGR